MKSSNMVLGGLAAGAARGQTAASPYGAPQQGYGHPGGGYPPAAPPQVSGAMTIDDVVVRTIGLLALTTITAGASWIAVAQGLVAPPTANLMLIGSMITGLVLVLVISFMKVVNPLLIGAYAVVQGVFLGVISQFFESLFPGIVLQAVIATLVVFVGMAALYKFRVIRATPFFRKAVIGALIGAVGLMLVNFVLVMFGVDAGLFNNPADGEKAGWLAWVIAIALVVIAAVSFILDFDMVEQGVRMGMERKFAWYCAFGILVGLIFLYLQLLRLIAMFRE